VDLIQNVLYLVNPELYVARDHLTLRIEENREVKLSVPLHHVESICVFGPITLSAGALGLCREHGVAVNYLSENGYFIAQLRGIPDTSVTLRRAHFRAADVPDTCVRIARNLVAGKIQNARNSLLRGARESEISNLKSQISEAADQLCRVLLSLADQTNLDAVRGNEGIAAQVYFASFGGLLKQQHEDFAFTTRNRRPPRDRINCLLSFLYALVRHDCSAALTSIGLDPFVGFLHAERANRPALALDLMEEFRPWLADRLAVTLINRKQIGPDDFKVREGGAVEFTDRGRRLVIKAYQERKQEKLTHPLLNQELRIGQMPFVQARILARVLRGDIPEYLPLLPK
jgi:CRISP-associated protein Cas1